MARELRSIEAGDIRGSSDLLRLVEELEQRSESALITSAGEEVAILRPLKRARPTPRAQRKSGVVSREDALWNIVGMADSAGPGDVAQDKHKYLAEAYTNKGS